MEEKLADFVTWAQKNITGDEKGEAQIFLDRLFQGFGQPGCLDVSGKPEYRIRKAASDGGGTAFADYVWKPVVLIEMKKRGTDLQKHYRQAFDYWTRLVPNRPRYVVLCNFDEFRVYDFETQMDSPVDTIALSELPQRYGALKFLAPGNPKPIFGNDRVSVTRQAADALAACFNHIISRKESREVAQRFTLQMLVSLFAEDIGLLQKYTVTQLLDQCVEPSDGYDLIGGLFRAMNTNPPDSGGRYKGIPYFNGGLFATPARVELDTKELILLRRAAKEDWSKVQPEIFGTLFQHSMDATERHAFGAHFTHPVDIMKIVGPTIVEPWREQIEGAKTLARLHELLERLREFRVLDPACGSGNFLYIAYRELKRLEARIFERIDEFSSQSRLGGAHLSYFTTRNFYGLDINPFAVEIAKVTMMIARKLAIDEFQSAEEALPLDNLDANFIAADALLNAEGLPAQWPKADVIIGNPPFLGAKLLKPEHGPDYVNKLRRAYPEVPGMADYCVYWFRKAHEHLPSCATEDPVAGRAGLVGTQNIRNNQSRVGGLDHIVKTGTIIEAVDNQPWSGEANVHVSIANWVKTQHPRLLPEKRNLWFKVEPERGKANRKRGQGSAAKEYELDVRECPHINSALSDETDVSGALELRCNMEPQRSFNGQMLGHAKFLLTKQQRDDLIRKDPRSTEVIFAYLNGREFLSGLGAPDRYVLDFGTRNQIEASVFTAAFAWVRDTVLPDRERKAQQGADQQGNVRPHHKQFLSRWWQLSFGRPELISRISEIPRYLACSLVTKRQVFVFVDSRVRPSNLLQVFTFADDYSFGIVSSTVHWEWFMRKCSKLKSDFRFGESVWSTFPWPQSPSAKQIETVAATGCEIRKIRVEALTKIKGGLRALYRMLELPGANPLKDAHAALDAAVLAAYGFDPKKDLLAQLLDINRQVAASIESGHPVTAPGIPKNYPEPANLITDDCIQPPTLAEKT
jgi:SAM-dependent methyltransferase